MIKHFLFFLTTFIVLSVFTRMDVNASTISHEIKVNSGDATVLEGDFFPKNIFVNEGDVIDLVFEVPADDTYCCGLIVRGNQDEFDTGVILPGHKKIIQFIAEESFLFTSYWAGTETQRGVGSITLNISDEDEFQHTPSVPQEVNAQVIGNSQVYLSWQGTGNTTDYDIYRDNVKVGSVKTLFFTDNYLEQGETYVYKITANNGAINSDFSEEILVEMVVEEDELDNIIFIDQSRRIIAVGRVSYGYDEFKNITEGDYLQIGGRTEADADIEIIVNSENQVIYRTIANLEGYWRVEVDTRILEIGKHQLIINVVSTLTGATSTETLPFEVSKEVFGVVKAVQDIAYDEKQSERYSYIAFMAGTLFLLLGLSNMVKMIKTR